MSLEQLKAVRVRDHMAKRVVVLDPEMEIARAVHLLVRKEISGAPVVDRSGRLVGILTERDCMRAAVEAGYHGMPGPLVRELMTADPETVGPDDSIFDLARRFIDSKYRRYPVIEDGELVGMISRRDVMRALGKLDRG